MKNLIISLVLLVVLYFVNARWLTDRSKNGGAADSAGELKEFELSEINSKALLTATELSFYKLLRASLPDIDIHTQVSVYQTIKINKGANSQRIWNRLNRMSFDFVLVDSETNVLGVIELDDSSHKLSTSQKRDSKKNELLAHLQIPLIRINVAHIPNSENLASMVRGAIDKNK